MVLAEGPAHFVGDDAGQGGLAEARRPREQEVVEGLLSLPGALDQQRQLLLDPGLAHELAEPPGAQRRVEVPFRVELVRRHHPLGHPVPTLRSAARSSSSTGWPSGSRPSSAVRTSSGPSPIPASASRTSSRGPSAGTSTSPPSFSLRSRTIRAATFFPPPGTTVIAS